MRRQRGQALVEAALVLPMLALLVFGALELGRMAFLVQSLHNAARDGARYSAVPAAGTSDLPAVSSVQQRVAADLKASGVSLSPFLIAVNQEVDISEGGLTTSFSQVKITYPFTFSTPLLSAILPHVTLTGLAVMRNETN
ncbi:MAG TPA: TadE family protein [Terriglobales bacterium]